MPSESFIVSKKVRGELVVWTETYQNLERGVDAETIVTSSGMSTTKVLGVAVRSQSHLADFSTSRQACLVRSKQKNFSAK